MRNVLTYTATAIVGLTMGVAAHADNIAITNGKVVTVDNGSILEGATVLIEGDKIKAVGPNVEIPNGFKVVDAAGRYVTPGFMSAGTNLGISEVGAVSNTNDGGVNGSRGVRTEVPFRTSFKISPAINPKASHIPITRIEGVTRAVVSPSGSDTLFAGQGAVIHLGDSWDLLERDGAMMVATYGNRSSSVAGGSRAAAWEYLTTALSEAAQADRRGARSTPNRERDSLLSAREAQALIPVVKGDMPLQITVNRASDILQVLKLKNEYRDIDLIISSGQEAWMVADQIAAAGVPVILDVFNNLPNGFDSLGATLDSAGRLEKAGVKVMFGGGQPRLNIQMAGNAVAHGMSWNGAIEALTVNPAMAYGIGDSYGKIKVGMDADVVLWSGDPLDVTSSPDLVVIQGDEIALESRQTKLRDRYMSLEGLKEKPPAYRK